LWENKATDFIYEIFNWVMVPLHATIFGHPPPRISDSIVTNLSSVADWYIEVKFSYLRVFGASVPPHALPLFIPDKLACREVARQTVIGGISKELKGYSKKVWPPFPVHLNSYSLLDFGHAKAEAAALEDLKLVLIEYKKHDPQRVVSNHLASCGLKRFEHENSPSDDIFRGTRSYAEILAQIQTLAPEERVDVLKFQEHRRSCLPAVLRGENLSTAEVKQKDVEGSKDVTPGQEKHQDEGEKTKSLKAEIKTPNPPKKQSLVTTPGQSTKKIGDPITSVTPLQSTQGNIDAGWIFNEELRPIRVEEIPPNEFFFDKKRKAVVKREFYQEGESTVKKYKVMTDGKDNKNEQFATKIVGTLGAYATTNQFSVMVLKNQLKRKNHLIKTLEARLATAAEAAKDQASVGIEKARLADKSEIELLKTKLEQAQLVVRDGQMQVSQQKYLIEQLQARVEIAESKVINIGMFQSQAMEIRSRVSTAQRNLLAKVEVIRDNCLLVNQVLENLSAREREAGAARVTFQEAVIATNNRDSGSTPRFTISEQTRGNILLKEWEHNISEGKLQAKRVTNSLEEAFSSIDGNLLGIDSGGNVEALIQMNMEKISLDLNEKEERDSAEISQVTMADIVQIDKCMIKPSTQLCAIDIIDRQMEDRLPQLARDCYSFEANCQAEPSRLISRLVERCVTCTEHARGQASGTK
jgi:hypothetical protein